MAVKYTTNQYIKSYIACRSELQVNAQEKITAATKGEPCKCDEKEQSKLIFLLFCLENIDHLSSDSEKDIVISKAMAAGKLAPGVVTDAEVTAFEATDKGSVMVTKI